MPSLRVLGRTWRVASDDFVLAGILAALHALLGYATALAALGESWVVASTGSEVESFVRFRIDILAFSHVCVAFSGLLLAYLSSRGLLWEESKRIYVPHALFLHGVLVVLSILFGTFALFSVPPQRRITSALTVSAAIAAWQGVLAAMATVAAYDAEPDLVSQPETTAEGKLWERRCAVVSKIFCCPGLMGSDRDEQHDAAVTSAGGSATAGRPLRRIARLLHSFLAANSVDLVASDYAAALLLVAAEQRAAAPKSADELAANEAPSPRTPARDEVAYLATMARFSLAAYGLPMHVWVHGAADVSHTTVSAFVAPSCPSFCAPILRLLRPRRMEEEAPSEGADDENSTGGWCADAAGRCGRRRRVDSVDEISMPTSSPSSSSSGPPSDSTDHLPPRPMASLSDESDVRATMERQAVLRLSGLAEGDLLRLSVQRWVGGRPRGGAGLRELPYFVALDRAHRHVVVSIRGTLSIDDCATDCLCEPAPLPAPLVGACHAGVLERALELSRSLRASGILHALLRDGARTSGVPDCAGWSLVFTGHSLGSGVAAVLSLLLRGEFPESTCVLFGPPGGLMDQTAAEQLPPSACTSVVLGWDWIPRLSVASAHSLRSQCISAFRRARVSKLQLVLRTGARRGRVPRAQDVLRTDEASSDDGSALAHEQTRLLGEAEAGGVLSQACDRFPGRCVYLARQRRLGAEEYELPPRRHTSARAEALRRRYAVCSAPQPFARGGLLVVPAMLSDHMPDLYAEVLDSLANATPLPESL